MAVDASAIIDPSAKIHKNAEILVLTLLLALM